MSRIFTFSFYVYFSQDRSLIHRRTPPGIRWVSPQGVRLLKTEGAKVCFCLLRLIQALLGQTLGCVRKIIPLRGVLCSTLISLVTQGAGAFSCRGRSVLPGPEPPKSLSLRVVLLRAKGEGLI